MKKLLLSATVVAGLFAAPTVTSLQKQINNLQKELKALKTTQQNQDTRYYKKVAPLVTNSHLFWSYDLRTTYDRISEKVSSWYNPQSGTAVPAQTYDNDIFTNRVILTGVAKPSDSLKATIRLEANNIYGMNDETSPWQNTPWFANESPDDINVRVKQAFFNYFFGDDLMFSAGRRPSTEGFPANLREDDPANSPLAHLINMEFDGFSFLVGNGEFSKFSSLFSDWGTRLKFCAGRGYSSSIGKYNSPLGLSYTKSDLSNMDFGGFLFTPYDNGQYSLETESVWAWHVQGYEFNNGQTSMQDYGDYFGENIVFKANGIGSGMSDTPISNFLYNTTAFVSFALSRTSANGTPTYIMTDPATGQTNTIYSQSHTGHSIWIGADMPGFRANDRFGISYVKGSKYWRSMTYGEDTLVGSIAAVRGHAFDVYYKAQIIPHLTANLRYTYLKYDYPGSDAFFGMFMDPDTYTQSQMPYVTSATDIRAYIRYRF